MCFINEFVFLNSLIYCIFTSCDSNAGLFTICMCAKVLKTSWCTSCYSSCHQGIMSHGYSDMCLQYCTKVLSHCPFL